MFSYDTFVQKCNIYYFAFKRLIKHHAKVVDNIEDDGSIFLVYELFWKQSSSFFARKNPCWKGGKN